MRKGLISFLLSLILTAFMGPALWAAGESFSADMVTTGPQGSMTSKMYSKGQKQRMETSMQGQNTTSIIRMDKKVMWVLMTSEKIYMEMPIKDEVTGKLHDPNVKMEKKFIADEKVDGHPTKKYHVTVISNGEKESGYLWEATDINNFPIKWMTEDKSSTVVWKNIKFGGIADSLFEIPSGYEKMSLPGGMPGM